MSLELARVVNDALQSNDFKAAFAALSEQPELRSSELPKLEKKSLTALAQALTEPSTAQTWVDALLSEIQSLHLFAYRTLLRLGAATKPLALPLKKAIEHFWEREAQVLADPQGQQNFAYHQNVERAIEVFFCMDITLALEMCKHWTRVLSPLANRQRTAYQAYIERQEVARKTLSAAVRELAQEKVGQSETRALSILSVSEREAVWEYARNLPPVLAAYEAVGPFVRVPEHLRYPYQDCGLALSRLFEAKGETQRTVSAQLREPLLETVAASLHANDATLADLSEGIFDLQIFDDAACETLIPALISMREDPAATQALRAADESSTRPTEARLSLWLKIIGRLRNGYYKDYSLERARQIYPLIQLGSAPSWFYDAFLHDLRQRHGAALTDATASNVAAISGPTSALADATSAMADTTIAHSSAEPLRVVKLLPVTTRSEGESALVFWQRATAEYLSNMKRVHDVLLKLHIEPAYLEDGTLIQHQRVAGLHAMLWDRYCASAHILNDEEKRSVLLHYIQADGGDGELAQWERLSNFRFYISGNNATKLRDLLSPLTPQLWENYHQVLQDIGRIEKAMRTDQHFSPQEFERVRCRFSNVTELISGLDDCDADLTMIKLALKVRGKQMTQQLEESVLRRKFDVVPLSRTGEKDAWHLDERYDALLEHLAQRVPRWELFSQRDGYSYLASGFYRRATPQARERCLHFSTLSGQMTTALFSCLEASGDRQMWLELLCVTKQRYSQFVDLWKQWRSKPEVGTNEPETGTSDPRESALQVLLNALPRSTTEQSTVLILKMLDDLTLQERAEHAATWATTLEHPHPKLAKWAFEALLTVPHPTLDWERAIETAGEKLWSEMLGLAKVAARFLGTVPTKCAPLAWHKLEDALELENTALVEAVLRAMIVLAAKDKALRLSDASQKRLMNVAQLAPERFGPLYRRLSIALVTT